MPQNKNFVERSVSADQELPFETLKFNDMRNADGSKGDWFTHILLAYTPKLELDQLTDAPGFNPESMQVTIQVNDVRITHATFEAMISEFSGRMLMQRVQRAHLDSFEDAVKLKAEQLLRDSIGALQENAYKLAENLGHLADQSSTIIENVWNAPYQHCIDANMKRAGMNAIEHFGPVDPNDVQRIQLAERVYRAMTTARPKYPINSMKVTLPGVVPAESVTGSPQADLIAQGRQQMLDEVMAALDAQGILFHRDPPPAEASDS